MSVASKKRLIEELKNKKFRDAYVAEHVKTSLPIQIYILREQRAWNQSQLAERAKTTQTVISRIEDPNYGKLSIATLLKLASAFDTALLVKFVPFTRLLDEFQDASPAALSAPDFMQEFPQLVSWADSDANNAIAQIAKNIELTQTPVLTGNLQKGQQLIEIQEQQLAQRLLVNIDTTSSAVAMIPLSSEFFNSTRSISSSMTTLNVKLTIGRLSIAQGIMPIRSHYGELGLDRGVGHFWPLRMTSESSNALSLDA